MDTLTDKIKQNAVFDKTVNIGFPERNLLIDITNFCNHKCIFCYHEKMTRAQRNIDEKIVEKALREAYCLGTREVGFYATGEPLLNNNLPHYIRMAKEIGYRYVYITTNGSLLNEEKQEALIKAGIDSIKFSINAASSESYYRIHGRDDFDKVIGNLIALSDKRLKNKLNFRIFISFIVTNITMGEKECFYNKYKKYVDDIFFYNVRNQTGLMYDEVNKLLVDNPREHISEWLPCSTVFNAITVTSEGYVSACCADFQNYLIVGDLNTQSMEEIWYGQPFKNLRCAHLEKKIVGTLCHNCVYHTNSKVEPILEEYATEI